MTQIGAPGHQPIDIGAEASPPFAVLPEPATLFARRAKRFRELAVASPIGQYLDFAGRLCALQADLLAAGPEPELPPQEALRLARDGVMPPLPLNGLADDPTLLAVLSGLTDAVAKADGDWPPAARQAARELASRDLDQRDAALDALVVDAVPPDRIAEHVLLAAALQVRMARAAARLDVGTLQAIADGVCPACGGAPVASTVVGRAGSQNARYCTCAMCGTEWNVVRVKCVSCSSTGGITYLTLDATGAEGGAKPAEPVDPVERKLARESQKHGDAIKGETCDNCRSYLKILYQVRDANLEVVADDTATLGLDLKLAEQGWRRAGRNLFLLGQGAAPRGGAGKDGATDGDAEPEHV